MIKLLTVYEQEKLRTAENLKSFYGKRSFIFFFFGGGGYRLFIHARNTNGANIVLVVFCFKNSRACTN